MRSQHWVSFPITVSCFSCMLLRIGTWVFILTQQAFFWRSHLPDPGSPTAFLPSPAFWDWRDAGIFLVYHVTRMQHLCFSPVSSDYNTKTRILCGGCCHRKNKKKLNYISGLHRTSRSPSILSAASLTGDPQTSFYMAPVLVTSLLP